jgi:hypothetical protein
MHGDDASADAKGPRDLRITTTDEFLAKAAGEYEKGLVDQALWRRAADRCGGDLSLVVATYLRSRAMALRLQHRQDQPLGIQARGASSTRVVSDRKIESDPHEQVVSTSTKFVGDRPRISQPKVWYLATAVAALVSTVAGVYVMVSPPENESVRQPFVANAARSPNQSAPSTPPIGGQPADKSAPGGANPDSPAVALAVTVQQLKSSGKWQVLVLNASEWTRREPGNATAWAELSFGYGKLEQFGEALDAAKRAVQIAPDDALLWGNLGRVNLDVDRLPEAGVAFAKALALNPGDADALCGAALVAQRQARPKDADTTIAKRVKASDGNCADLGDGAGATAPVASTAPRKPAASVGH